MKPPRSLSGSTPTRLALTLLMTLATVAIGIAAAANRRPNILFIMVDEMRWNAMGCAGNPLVSTPNLDRLAREGTRFASAYTCAAICTPSRYSFFTSRYAHVHGSTDNATAPRPGQLLLPSLLRSRGYETAISGKLHFLPARLDYDFERFWSFASEGPGKLQRWPEYMDARHGRNSARRVVADSRPFPDDPLGRDYARLPYPPADMQTSWITDRAVEFLGRHDASRPYFLFVSYLDPHSPSHLSEPYYSMYQKDKARIPLPDTFVPGGKTAARQSTKGKAGAAAPADTDDDGGEGGRGKGRHDVNDPEIVRTLTAAYYAKMKLVDDNLGRLLEALAKSGSAEDTLVLFTADHGNMLGDHNKWFKGVMYEGSARIPLIVKAPASGPHAASFNRGRIVPEIVENIDVMPTVLEMIGQPLPTDPGFQGKSLVRLVAGEDPLWKNTAFCERNSCMIRTARHKLIANGGLAEVAAAAAAAAGEKAPERAPRSRGDDRTAGPRRRQNPGASFELYDLLADPQETKNLAGDPAHASTFRDLLARLAAWGADSPPTPRIEGVRTDWAQEPGKDASRSEPAKKRRERERKNQD